VTALQKTQRTIANLIRPLHLSFPQEGQVIEASTNRCRRLVKRGLVRAGADMLARHATVAPHPMCQPCWKPVFKKHRFQSFNDKRWDEADTLSQNPLMRSTRSLSTEKYFLRKTPHPHPT